MRKVIIMFLLGISCSLLAQQKPSWEEVYGYKWKAVFDIRYHWKSIQGIAEFDEALREQFEYPAKYSCTNIRLRIKNSGHYGGEFWTAIWTIRYNSELITTIAEIDKALKKLTSTNGLAGLSANHRLRVFPLENKHSHAKYWKEENLKGWGYYTE